jgi:ABC-type nitrate/sulfonate/bicarbonate transport system substrate-binding protein
MRSVSLPVFPILAFLGLLGPTAARAENPSVAFGMAKCAHCVPLVLLPDYAKGVTVKTTVFTNGNDVMTALLSQSLDIAQVTYVAYITALDRGLSLVAVSGQIGGGSQILLRPGLGVAPGDWAGLAALVAKYKAEGKPFRVAASRGSPQDLDMRGVLAGHGIIVDKDVTFTNISDPATHSTALRTGAVELICSVDPFASEMRLSKTADFFEYPYDQAGGNLANVILTRPDVIKAHPGEVQAVVDAVGRVNQAITADHAKWAATITKVTGLDTPIADAAITNLYPDVDMPRSQVVAIAKLMHELHYISHDDSEAVSKNLDYQFLQKATGKSEHDLGG